jgi:FHS family L-fucose permease-like MFS transporter
MVGNKKTDANSIISHQDKSIIEEENAAIQKQSYLLPGILVTTLFFLWGFSYGLLDTLNKHFQNTLGICKYL